MQNLTVDEKEDLALHIQSMQTTLSRCPFCACNAEIKNTWTISYWVECMNCDAQVPDTTGEGRDGTLEEHKASIAKAAKNWNKRKLQA